MTRLLALGCVGFLASAPALAADADADAEAPRDIIVSGAREQLDSPKAVAPLINTPRSVVVVSAETIENTGSTTLAEALRTVPGITFGAAEGGNPIGDRPFIRGFDSQGSTFLDGVRDIGAQSREVFAVEQVQVVRGSDSTLAGRGAPGGSINIISKLPRLEDFASVSGSYGNADFKRAVGDVNLRLGETVAFRIQGLWHDQNVAGRDAIFQKRWGFAPSVSIGLGTPTKLTFAYYHLDTDELPDTGLPYLYTIGNTPNLGTSYSEPAVGTVTTRGGQTGRIDRSTFYGLVDRDFRKTKVDQMTIRAEHDFGGVALRNTSRYSHTQQSYIFTQPDDSQGNVFGTTATNAPGQFTSGGYVWRRVNTRYGYTDSLINQTDLYGQFATGGLRHSFAVGAELAWEKARRGTFVLATGATSTPRCTTATVGRFNCTSLFAPNPNDPWVNYASDASAVTTPIARTLPIQETQTDARTRAVYAFDSITLAEPLILNLAIRWDQYRSAVTPGQAATATSTFRLRRKDDLVNWQAGLVFKPTAATSLYASYATSASPPNSLIGEGQEANGLGTANTAVALGILDTLKVEKTKSYEAGAKADLFDRRLSLTAAVFQTETANARVQVDANTVSFVGKRRVRGVEIGYNGQILPGWKLFGGYTYLDAKIREAGFSALTAPAVGTRAAQVVYVPSVSDGKRFPQTAKHSFTAWSDVTLGRLSLGGGAFYTSRVFGGYSDNRAATQTAAGVVTVTPATKILARTAPSYWRFDARAAFRVSPAIELSVNAQNLTDKTYFNQVYTSHYASIAPGRTVFGTVSLRY